MASEKHKMIAGELYRAGDPELVADRKRAQALMRDYNATVFGDEARAGLLDALLGSRGESCALRAPVYVDYGYNIHLGRDVFLNYGCVLLDVCEIRVGDMTQIGPYAQILTADHPRDGATRDAGLEFGRPITIGRNVWIGGGALILPGVTVGDDAVIGAGAVVTRDVAPGVTVAGNPARPLVGQGAKP
ncbi:sugar O-acetyltransferase [Aestuariicoccus sp. MJ-SS9]|uniref:sugar O-acetyltransferase n=1 Tax=Aestuariicoccus sp. MJ-SS9 TaxID=3079855 RepID=UPI002909B23E|nr:sugar O-acetyltransferase [Aestuariicoccus sp. MJ-SS9]MDU8910610.1 sugar O-acetyltransferase [Aestuariicoccus sp. MJ-SS9]